MKICRPIFCTVFAVLFICMAMAGCADLPLKEGGLAVGKNTTVGVDDVGVGRVTSQF